MSVCVCLFLQVCLSVCVLRQTCSRPRKHPPLCIHIAIYPCVCVLICCVFQTVFVIFLWKKRHHISGMYPVFVNHWFVVYICVWHSTPFTPARDSTHTVKSIIMFVYICIVYPLFFVFLCSFCCLLTLRFIVCVYVRIWQKAIISTRSYNLGFDTQDIYTSNACFPPQATHRELFDWDRVLYIYSLISVCVCLFPGG